LLASLRAYELSGDARGVVSTMAGLGAAIADTDPPVAAGWLAGGIDKAVSIGYWHGEAYCVVATICLLVTTGQLLDAVRLDAAMTPHLPTLRASMPPDEYTGYRKLADSARRGLSPAVFDAAAAELTGNWTAVRDRTAAITRSLAAANEPGLPKPRIRGPRSNPELTERELEVLTAIASGLSNPKIASAMHLSAKTVMHHSMNVYRKLGVRGRAEAVALAYRTGLLQGTSNSLLIGQSPDVARPSACEGHHVRGSARRKEGKALDGLVGSHVLGVAADVDARAGDAEG